VSETLLEAGAIRPGPPREAGLDAVTARSYRHPVLEGRTVVRLVGAAVGPAEDLTMEFLGFAPAGEPVPVGHGRRQALGFPAWALVHDQANGRHALALVKEMERLARVARSKPGNAKDGYDGLAGRLGAAAPQFLPTFWEQAGRAFLAAENQRMAGTCFTEARRAEQVHGLVVDEERVRDVHLEFAFAGALTAAMLAEYARGVVGRRPAVEAFELMKMLALRRVAGGLPPHASMAADLARLAKAAGLDADQQADEVVARLLTYPATVRAHPSVWKSYRKSLVRLGKRDPAVRGRLLAIVPEPPGYDTDMTEQWLELLEASGAAADLAGPDAPASRWLERFLAGRRTGRAGRSARLLALVERMLPRLAAGGEVRIATGPWGVDIDVLDLLRAGGVPVGIEAQRRDGGFNLAAWASDDSPGRRDLTAIAADPALRQVLRRGVRTAIGRLRDGASLTSPPLPARTLAHAFGAPGVREVLVELVAGQTSEAGAGTVAGLDADLIELAPLWSPAGMLLAPDGFRELLAVDLAAVLARTLRAGLLAELCWPEFEAAAKQKLKPQIGRSWPELVVHDDQSAHVIAPDGRVTEHVFRYPPAGHRQVRNHYSQTTCLHADGDLLVAWAGQEGPAGYWASRPDDVIDGDWRARWVGLWVAAVPLPVPGGGLTFGARPVHAGDVRGSGEAYPLASDGQAYWRCEWVRGESADMRWRWREFDPMTGDDGRVSMPAFFAAGDGRLVAQACSLRPAPDEFAASPLGWRDGLVGWRTTETGGVQAGEGADGRRVTFAGSEILVGAVSLPGSATPLPVTRADGYPRDRLRVWTAGGEHLLAEQSEVTTTLPPMAWWHAMRPRDEAGSAALRAIDEPTAAALLAVDDTVTSTAEIEAAATANVKAHLPAVADPVLRARIGEVVASAVRMRRRIAEIPEHLRPQAAPAPTLPAVTDDALRLAWDGLVSPIRTYYGGSSASRHQTLEQVSVVGDLLATAVEPAAIPAVCGEWTVLLAGLGAAALRAATAVTSDADRQALTVFLAAVAGTPLAGDGPPVRLLELSQTRMSATEVEVRRDGSQITVLFPTDQHYSYNRPAWNRLALQVAPDGAFTLPEGVTLRDESRAGGRLAGDRVRAFCALLGERGPAPWRPAAVEALAGATGMTRAEATLLLAGLPGIAAWESTFLTTEQRTVLGLTAAHAKVARAALREVPPRQRIALLDAAMPAEPADLWAHGPDVAAVAETWIELRGRRIAVPEHLVAELARVIGDSAASAVLQAIAAPTAGDWLSTDGRSESRGYFDLRTVADEGTPFDASYLQAASLALPWLAYRLRWDDPLRTALPAALELTRARLRNPHLLVGLGMHAVGERPDAGPALVDGHGTGDHTCHHIAPAKLSGDDDPALGFVDDTAETALRILLSGWIDEAVSVPDGAAGDPHDPRVSAPQVVDEVRERFGCGGDAAAYYLQLLALPDPTDKAVQGWNDWKPARLHAAQQALAGAGLVVTAKRERAGRPVFLPGGWQAARAPRSPMETWKQELYFEAGRLQFVPHSLPRLFATAWARVAAGDVPRYHDLKETP